MNNIKISTVALSILLLVQSAYSQIGKPFIHDPSTIVECEGKYFTFGTGGGGLISNDGWTWHGGGVRPGGGAAPDVIKIGNRYLIAFGATGGSPDHKGAILTMWNNTLDPKSPNFKYTEPIVVATSDGYEECDAIDPGVMLDPTTGKLWLTYGTYFGYIRLVELDPQTGALKKDSKPTDLAIVCEASTLVYKEGWYYLLATHGTCCDGANSTYNVVVGRSKNIKGPYLDNVGRSMLQGGGKMVVATRGNYIGPGHFGHIVLEPGVEKMSLHYEADLNQGGRSVLGILPVIWKDGWPIAGEKFKDNTYEIESVRRGYALELAVDFARMPNAPRGFNQPNQEPIKPVVPLQLDDVKKNWPEGNINARVGDYMSRPHQKWAIADAPDTTGYLGNPYYKIVIEGTNRALAVSEKGAVITVPEYTGATEQLWRLDQLTDGTYRIMPKSTVGSTQKLVLISSGDSTPALGKFDFKDDNCKWNLNTVH